MNYNAKLKTVKTKAPTAKYAKMEADKKKKFKKIPVAKVKKTVKTSMKKK